MKSFVTLCIGLGLCSLSMAQTETNQVNTVDLRRLMHEAKQQYLLEDEEALSQAAERFRMLKEQGDEGEFNVDALRLAEGLSRLRAGQPDHALKALEDVQGFDTAEERSRHRLLKGSAQFQLAEQLAAEEKWAPAKETMQGAIESLTHALKENPTSEAARHNLELAHRELTRIQKQQPPPPPTPTAQPTPPPTPDATPTPEPSDQPPATPTPEPGNEENGEEQQPQQPENGEQQPQESSEREPSQNEENGQPSESSTGGELSDEEIDAQQAREVLDAYLEQEKKQRRQLLKQKRVRTIPVEKDW